MKNNSDIKKRNFLTQNEIESLLNAANSGPHAARNYCLTLLCFIHGFRASEICRLRISDIDLRSKCIYIHRLKKGFSTTHPLLNKEIQALKRWLDIRDEYPQSTSEWLFLSRKGNPLSRQQFYQIISASGDQAGLPLEIHPHMLRHSCGFALANMGIDTRLIQDYLGHRNIRHTVWYTASNAGRFYGIWDNSREQQRISLFQ
ncbi:integrase [Klebsiella aerogenes]|uniref:tyrosine-type DNA invertase n=1 Tax=Klebsiella aerogenes TaxID=548 RepID=UPI000F7F93BE|nr:tyrosine-type DNA invertase [Klebsiella aerogenes]RSW22546.1 integrase [Klebsiella aerogenes]